MSIAGSLGRIAFGGWALVVAVLCFVPSETGSPAGLQLCLICGDSGTADFGLNVLLFVPLGVAFRARGRSLLTALALGALLSLGIEIVQLWVPGRFSTLGDLVANAFGVGLGFWTAGQIVADATASPRVSPAIPHLWGLGATAAFALTGLSVQPSIPEGDLFANWIPRIEEGRFNRGRILNASMGDLPLPSRRLERPEVARTLLAYGVPVDLRFELGTTRRYTLFRLIGEGEHEAVRIDLDGADVLVSPRFRAADLRLARPWLRFRGLLGPYSEGDVVALSLRSIAGGGYELSVGPSLATMGVSPTMGWIFLRPVSRSRAYVVALGLLWTALLFLPLGFFSVSIRRTLGSAILPMLMMILLPIVTPLLYASAADWTAVVGALAAGHAAGRWQESRRPATCRRRRAEAR